MESRRRRYAANRCPLFFMRGCEIRTGSLIEFRQGKSGLSEDGERNQSKERCRRRSERATHLTLLPSQGRAGGRLGLQPWFQFAAQKIVDYQFCPRQFV